MTINDLARRIAAALHVYSTPEAEADRLAIWELANSDDGVSLRRGREQWLAEVLRQAIAEEREACARLAAGWSKPFPWGGLTGETAAQNMLVDIAAAIRARGDTTKETP